MTRKQTSILRIISGPQLKAPLSIRKIMLNKLPHVSVKRKNTRNTADKPIETPAPSRERDLKNLNKK